MKQYDIGKKYDDDESKERLKYKLKPLQQQREEEAANKIKKKKRIKLLIVMLSVLAPCIVFSAIMYKGYVKTNQAYSDIERDYTNLAMSYASDSVDVESDIEDKNMVKQVDFESLMAEIPDIYSWIYIPDTNVDYPILQSGDDKLDEDYWLNHNLDGSEGYPGTIFTERMFGKDFETFNTIIYGHDMNNQTMFGVLHNFEREELYFDSHEYVYIYTQDMTYKYQIVCVSTISDVHLSNAYSGYATENNRQKFIDYIISKAKYSRDTTTGIYDNYITLSTCTVSEENRFVVLAKCVEKISNID